MNFVDEYLLTNRDIMQCLLLTKGSSIRNILFAGPSGSFCKSRGVFRKQRHKVGIQQKTQDALA
jgi:hypothetical protein